MNYQTNAPAQHYQYAAGAMNSPQAAAINPGIGSMPAQGYFAHGTGYGGYPMYVAPNRQQHASLFNERFLKGLLIGAAAAYILTNENVQRTAIKGAVKAWSLLQGGVEELKERFRDAEAEIRAESSE